MVKSERFNYTLINCAQNSLILEQKMDIKFWDFAVKYANLLYNKAPHNKDIQNIIPKEFLYKYNKPSNIKLIKVFRM